MIRLFEGSAVSETYALFRPQTSPNVATVTMKYMQSMHKSVIEPRYDLMIDVGCGSGQSTGIFANYFKSIIGVDLSTSQIETAKTINKFANINFMEASAEDIPASGESVDLLTCGQAAHWFDLEKFFAECHRTLKPGGCLVMHGYDRPRISMADQDFSQVVSQPDAEAEELLKNFYNLCKFHPNRKHVDDHYTKIFHALPTAQKIKDETIKLQKQCTLQDFVNYLKTWSGYRSYVEEQQKRDSVLSADILSKFVHDLKATWQINTDNTSVPVIVTWDVFVLLSGRPMK